MQRKGVTPRGHHQIPSMEKFEERPTFSERSEEESEPKVLLACGIRKVSPPRCPSETLGRLPFSKIYFLSVRF